MQLSFFSAYFLVSLPAGKVIASVGYKRGIRLGLAIAGVGALLFYPAASLPSYGFFLAALFVLASGIAFLQVAANPFVAGLGPKEGAPSRLNLTQAFNSLGTTLALFFGSTLRDALRGRHLALGGLAIFIYVGAEVSIGSFLVSFLEQPSTGHMDAVTAARHISYYRGGAMVGRFAGSLALRKLDAGKLLAGIAPAGAPGSRGPGGTLGALGGSWLQDRRAPDGLEVEAHAKTLALFLHARRGRRADGRSGRVAGARALERVRRRGVHRLP